ncbi:MAG TPA: NAD(P)H-dependent oxidoreductase subunit E [Candidatus Kapabacteria bacterium]|nr:NAD(P)H-dependent oxidoreductase subunit E [Candidatus Kapabacteria bacterium]
MPIFSESELQEIAELQKRYPQPAATLLPVLWRLQEKRGWIDDEAMECAAAVCQVSKSHVHGVVSFYTMFFDKPMGRFHVQVCTNVSCMLCGGEELLSAMKNKLGIQNLEHTPDGMFSLEETECMGACGGAPMMAVNEIYFEKITNEEAAQVIEHVRAKGEIPKPKFVAQMPELTEAANR